MIHSVRDPQGSVTAAGQSQFLPIMSATRAAWLVVALAVLVGVPAIGWGAYATVRSANAVPLPLKVTWRESFWEQGMVLRLTNTSDLHLTLLLDVHNPTLGRNQRLPLYLNPHTTTEVGWTRGWRFMSGDRITLRSSGYQERSLIAP